MGLLCDYFVAGDDEQAALTIGWLGGPGSPPPPKGLFKRTTSEPLPTLSMPGIEPVVMMSTLENQLTGKSLEDLINENAQRVVAMRDGGEGLVVRLSEALQHALATTADTRLRQAADPWSRTEEFGGQADPAHLGGLLVALSTLAKRGEEAGQHLYCWLCV